MHLTHALKHGFHLKGVVNKINPWVRAFKITLTVLYLVYVLSVNYLHAGREGLEEKSSYFRDLLKSVKTQMKYRSLGDQKSLGCLVNPIICDWETDLKFFRMFCLTYIMVILALSVLTVQIF